MPDQEVAATPNRTFLTLMTGNRAGVWTSIGGGILIFLIWQMALVIVALNFPLVRFFLLEGGTGASARDEALGMGLLLIGGFGPAFIITLVWRKLMERRHVRTLVTAAPTIRWRLMVGSAFIVGVTGLGLTFAFDPDSLTKISARLARFSTHDWMLLAIAYGIGISVQASFEEVYLRGWLLQHISRFIPNAAAAIVTTSIIFCLLHVGHPGWATYVATLTLGLAYGWSAFRLNGLEAAIGAHIANNLVAALLTGQMISGNPPTMDAGDFALYAAYVLGFLVFVEVWARFFDKPSRD